MTTVTGFLRPLNIRNDRPLAYSLQLDSQPLIPLNQRLLQSFTFEFLGDIQCVNCHRQIKKSFNQGYCFVCFRRLARCDSCIIKPELCHFHLGTCREPEWGEAVCMKKHIVYLSYTSGIKVGITRFPNVPKRWFDQGANVAMPIYQVSTRLQSGLVEVILKQCFKDKTHWRRMLDTHDRDVDLKQAIENALKSSDIEADISNHPKLSDIPPKSVYEQAEPMQIHYPMTDQPFCITSINAEKTPLFSGRLLGMKGQYMCFDTGVINIRKYTGYKVSITLQ